MDGMEMRGAARPWLAACALALVCVGGCVAIPMGSEEFSAEYAGEIRPGGGKAEKTYEPSVAAGRAEGAAGMVEIGLEGDVTVRHPRQQHYERVSLTKRKRFVLGIAPLTAEGFFTPHDALVPVDSAAYCGAGTYGGSPPPDEPGAAAIMGGTWLKFLTLGVVSTPLTFLAELFGPFENGHHYQGRWVDSRKGGQLPDHDGRDIDLLLKFPPRDRERIGAWTWHENAEHPHNTFWRGFAGEWVGVAKYCTYVVHEPVETERTTPADPAVSRERLAAMGPYGVFLQIPELGFARTMGVPRGEARARFDLAGVADGRREVQGLVRFLPPSGGMSEAWDDDARAMLGAVQGRDFPVTLRMPPPRLVGDILEPAPRAAPMPRDGGDGAYRIAGVQRSATGGLRVRVRLSDPAGAEEVDRAVRPRILAIYRERIAAQANGVGGEKVERRTEEGGRVIVYSVEPGEGGR